MADDAWEELAAVSDLIYRLSRELRRCVSPSRHREQLKAEIRAAEERKADLIATLTNTVPGEVAEERDC